MDKDKIDRGKVKALNVASETKLRTLNERNEVPGKESQKGLWLLCDPKEVDLRTE